MSSSSPSRDYTDLSAPPHLCQNCGTPLRGPFCSHCGQHDIDYHRSFHHLTHDLLENVFHFEGKFFTSVAWLLATPGRLTREFLAGRRQRQLNPLRFYLFVSVLFFLVLTLLNHGHLFNVSRDSLLDFGHDRSTHQAASAEPAEAPNQRVQAKTEFSDALSQKFKNGDLTTARVLQEFEHRVPTLFFLGVPLFALLLKLLYLRSGRFYIEHLIFSLHLHTWAFLAALLGNGYGQLFGLGAHWLSAGFRFAFTLWLFAYVLLAVRAVYAQSWRKTVFKTALATIAYGFCLTLLAAALAIATILWLALE